MKIQNLAIIFIIIILPISMILSEYVKSQVKTIEMQITYDKKLDNATADALKAFQLNTINNATSDIANSKLRDIEAAANTFFNSIASNFNLSGYNQDILKDYVPAIVFTMYDGYYIYSRFTNDLTDEDWTAGSADQAGSTYQDGQTLTEIKPYINYSCRYKRGASDDFVITYTLDNYITIQGKINGKDVYDYGYLLNDVSGNGETATYRGIRIDKEPLRKEYIGPNNDPNNEYEFLKINGEKYYKYKPEDIANGENEGLGNWFSLLQDTDLKGQGNFKDEDPSAVLYYTEAAEFSDRFLNEYHLGDLKTSDAVDENGNPILDENGNPKFGNYQIFIFDDGGTDIEDPESNFNSHRLDVIRYSIEKNLSIAIANYNDYSTVKANFLMPELKEDEWTKILNNVSIISFLQGLNIGGKIYNGYSIITNNKNEEAVQEDSIYIVGSDGNYHRVNDKKLLSTITPIEGVLNLDFERASRVREEDNVTQYFFPRKNADSACYSCIINQYDADIMDNVYDYLENAGNTTLSKVYYTALGRERYALYKSNNNRQEMKAKFE